MASMLPGAPWLLAHKSMLETNKPRQISLQGKDYVMWKDKAGNVRALPNACPHMGAMLSAGWCEESNGSSSVVCPFHALAFDAEGCTVLPGTNKKTLPLSPPLELIIQGDFIWSYGGFEPKIPIPSALNEIAQNYHFVGHTVDLSVETDLLSMLLNMHDYNHQNGAHRELFRITDVELYKFIDSGRASHAFYRLPTAPYTLIEKLKKPDLFVLPNRIDGHLENYFPCVVIFRTELWLGKLAECHIFVPEADNRTRTYILMFSQPKHPSFKIFDSSILNLANVLLKQDADILTKIYPNAPKKIKLNNEVGMDWVRRNFDNFPDVVEPNLSQSSEIAPAPEIQLAASASSDRLP